VAEPSRAALPDYRMDLETVERFILASKGIVYNFVTIAGGEPLLWGHLAEAVGMLKAAKITTSLRVFTNGLRADALTPPIVEALDVVRISDHGQPLDACRAAVPPEKLQIVPRKKHTPLPTEIPTLARLPVGCFCRSYGVTEGRVFPCPLLPPNCRKLGIPIRPEFSTEISEGYMERIAERMGGPGHWGKFVLCAACVANVEIRQKNTPKNRSEPCESL